LNAVIARDAPNDAGGAVDITWLASPLEKEEGFKGYDVQRRAPGVEAFATIAEITPGEAVYQDKEAKDGVPYEYRVRALPAQGPPVVLGISGATASGQWFNTARTNALIGVIFTSFVIIFFIYRAKGGAELFVRKIAGITGMNLKRSRTDF